MPETDKLMGDFWGGLAAMLVALPSAIAFGVIIYSPLGGTYAAHGALAMTTPGDTSMVNVAEVEAVMKGKGARVIR